MSCVRLTDYWANSTRTLEELTWYTTFGRIKVLELLCGTGRALSSRLAPETMLALRLNRANHEWEAY